MTISTEIKLADLAIIFATLVGPIVAIQVQKILEAWREEKDRRVQVFKTLMATRATRLEPTHIQALNMINMEYPAGRKEFKKVRSAWKAYFTHLSEKAPEDKQLQAVHFAKRDELFTDLLYEMGTALNYDFDKTEISKEVYSTIHQETLELQAHTIRTKLVDILTGKAAIPMDIMTFPGDPAAMRDQAEYFRVMAERLRAEKPLPVAIVNNTNRQEEEGSSG